MYIYTKTGGGELLERGGGELLLEGAATSAKGGEGGVLMTEGSVRLFFLLLHNLELKIKNVNEKKGTPFETKPDCELHP